MCDHLKESYRAVLSFGAVCCAVEFCSTHPRKAIEQFFLVVLFAMLYKVVLWMKP